MGAEGSTNRSCRQTKQTLRKTPVPAIQADASTDRPVAGGAGQTRQTDPWRVELGRSDRQIRGEWSWTDQTDRPVAGGAGQTRQTDPWRVELDRPDRQIRGEWSWTDQRDRSVAGGAGQTRQTKPRCDHNFKSSVLSNVDRLIRPSLTPPAVTAAS